MPTKLTLSSLFSSVLLLLAFSAQAVTIKLLEFEVDGQLPSAETDIVFFNNSGVPENDRFSVEMGLLKQRTFDASGNSSYLYQGGGLDPAMTTTIEARLSISEINGQSGVYFQAFDGQHWYGAWFEEAGVALRTIDGTESVVVDFTDFHDYKLVSPGSCSVYHLFVDDVYQTSVEAWPTSENGFGFGDGLSAGGHGGNADWDSIHLSQSSGQQGPDSDIDQDGVLDLEDNCLTIENVDQRDTDADGFGNLCDADFNGDMVVNIEDLGVMRSVFFSSDADADLNGDGVVNVVDLGILRTLFFSPPGPSCVIAKQ